MERPGLPSGSKRRRVSRQPGMEEGKSTSPHAPQEGRGDGSAEREESPQGSAEDWSRLIPSGSESSQSRQPPGSRRETSQARELHSPGARSSSPKHDPHVLFMCTKHLGGSHVFEDQLEYVSCSHTGEQALLNNVARAAGSHWFAATLAFAMKRGFREIRMVPMSGGGPNAQTAFLREFFHKGDNLEKVEPLGTVSHQVAPATAPAHPFVYSGQDPRAFTAPPEPQFTPGFAPVNPAHAQLPKSSSGISMFHEATHHGAGDARFPAQPYADMGGSSTPHQTHLPTAGFLPQPMGGGGMGIASMSAAAMGGRMTGGMNGGMGIGMSGGMAASMSGGMSGGMVEGMSSAMAASGMGSDMGAMVMTQSPRGSPHSHNGMLSAGQHSSPSPHHYPMPMSSAVAQPAADHTASPNAPVHSSHHSYQYPQPRNV